MQIVNLIASIHVPDTQERDQQLIRNKNVVLKKITINNKFFFTGAATPAAIHAMKLRCISLRRI